MRLDVFTLFPEWFEWFMAQRHVRNVVAEGDRVRFFNPRVKTPLNAGQVDDTPYGGGAGMVMRVDVIDAALEAAYGDGAAIAASSCWPRAVASSTRPSPPSWPPSPTWPSSAAATRAWTSACASTWPRTAVSIGPYVLSGGEPAAMVVADAVLRKLPGALGHETSAVEESFSEALEGAPEYPHYTRPAEYRGWGVPEVLLSGDHARIASGVLPAAVSARPRAITSRLATIRPSRGPS